MRDPRGVGLARKGGNADQVALPRAQTPLKAPTSNRITQSAARNTYLSAGTTTAINASAAARNLHRSPRPPPFPSRYAEPSTRTIVIATGPRVTMNIAGRIRHTSGNRIFVGAFCARSSIA